MCFILAVFFLVLLLPGRAEAGSEALPRIPSPNSGAVKGDCLYYSWNGGGTRDGLICLNLRTGKRSTLLSYKLKSLETNGFGSLSIRGDYIYAVWDQLYGSYPSLNYIYRISLKTGKAQRLGIGYNPVLYDGKLYYRRCVIASEGGTSLTKDKSWAVMNLDGSGSKDLKKLPFQLTETAVGGLLYEKGKVETLTSGSTRYDISAWKILRLQAGGKKEMFRADSGWGIQAVHTLDGALLVYEIQNGFKKARLYAVSEEGKKFFLKEWKSAE